MSEFKLFQPLHDRVLVKRRKKKEEQTAGGLLLPETAQETINEGEVIEVGPGKYNEDGTRQRMDVKKGDYIAFGKYSGTEIKIGGEEYLILREDEISGVLK